MSLVPCAAVMEVLGAGAGFVMFSLPTATRTVQRWLHQPGPRGGESDETEPGPQLTCNNM